MAQGATRQDLLLGFSESSENIARTAHAVRAGLWDANPLAAQIARLYDTMLDRAPDVVGLNFYKAQIASGQGSLLELSRAFRASPEFRARYGVTVSDVDFVHLLYRNSLDREPGAGEVSYYVDRLATHQLERTGVVLAFSESPEHQALTHDGIVGNGMGQYGIAFA